MNPKRVVVLVALLLLGLPAADVLAQDGSAEVRTWSGQMLRLSQITFEVRYTIVPAKSAGGTGALGPAPSGAAAGPYAGPLAGGFGMSTSGGGTGLGSLPGFQQFVGQSVDPIQGRRPVDYLNAYQDGVAHRLAVSRITNIVFRRRPLLNSTLPPYVAPEHALSSATVTFTDGSVLDADYINLGTMLLRGATPEGRVEVPWEEIETVRFSR